MINGIKIILHRRTLVIGQSALNYFQEKLKNGTISQEEYESLLTEEDQMNRKEILKYHQPAIKQLSNGRYYTRIEGKTVQSMKLKNVEDSVVNYYATNAHTLSSIFEDFLKFESAEKTDATLYRDRLLFERFIKTAPFADKPLIALKMSDASEFLEHCLSINPEMKEKYWTNIMGVVNQMFKYAIGMEYTTFNPFENFHPNRIRFCAATKHRDEDTVFSQEEKIKVCELALMDATNTKTAIPLAILILFQLGLRDGEVCALKWGDIESGKSGDTIHIQRMVVVNYVDTKACGYKVVDFTKTPTSDRILHLSEKTKAILERAKELNNANGFPTGKNDYIFMREFEKQETYISTRCVFSRLEKYCKAANMEEIKSPHDIRRTVITELHEKGYPLKKLQKFAGHSTLAMTLKYIRETDLTDFDKQILDSL